MPSKNKSLPHIRDKASIPGMMWTVVLALMPAVLTSIFFSGFNAFRVLTIAVASALLSEMAVRKILGSRISIYDGSAVVTALLLALLVPSTLPSWMIALGSVFAIVVGKEIFGGLGQNIFNPALVGVSFLYLSFPIVRDLVSEPPETSEMIVKAGSVLLGGVLLWLKRLVSWEIPLLYLGTIWIFSSLFNLIGNQSVFSSTLLLAGFFIVTDPVTTPLTREGNRWFALGAGFLTAVLRLIMNSAEALTSGVLVMNALNLWLDQWCRPRR